MVGGRAVFSAVVIVVVLAACGSGVAPSPPGAPSTDRAEAGGSPPVSAPIPSASPLPTPTPEPTTAPTPAPTPDPTAVPVPPKPTGVTFGEKVRELSGGRLEHTYTVTWRAPTTKGLQVKVYGITECLSKPKSPPDAAEGPCLVEHTTLPSSVLERLAAVPASDGTASWTWIEEPPEGCDYYTSAIGPDGTRYEAVVLAAYNGPRESVMAIAEPGSWCTSCMIC
jgi:hypothetical protein